MHKMNVGDPKSPQRNVGQKPRPRQPKPQTSTTASKVDQGRGVTNKSNSKNEYLSKSLLKMETALGIRRGNSDRCVSPDLPIREFSDKFIAYYNSLQMAEKNKMPVALQSGLTMYQLLMNYFRYYREIRISFDGFTGLDDVVKVLRLFRYDIEDIRVMDVSAPKPHRHKVQSQKVRELNKILTVLHLVDAKSEKARKTVYAYRFLRLFCLCVYIGDYVTASVLADTLLDQILLEQKYKYRSSRKEQ